MGITVIRSGEVATAAWDRQAMAFLANQVRSIVAARTFS